MIQKKQNFFTCLKSHLPNDPFSLSLSKKNRIAGSKLGLNDGYDKNQNRFSRLTPLQAAPKQEVVSITYEEIGLFPRSFSRVLDRFLKQVFSDVENLVIQEYRFYRYLFLTTLKCLLILFFVPFLVNFLAKSYVVRPLTEYFWNTKQTEIFLNSYQQKHAFAELKDFEEKLYFESLIYPKSVSKPQIGEDNKSSSYQFTPIKNNFSPSLKENQVTNEKLQGNFSKNWVGSTSDFVNFYKFPKNIEFKNPMRLNKKKVNSNILSKLPEHGRISYINHSLRPVSLIFKKQKNEYILNPNILNSSLENQVGRSFTSPPVKPMPPSLGESETRISDSRTKNKNFFVHPVIGYTESNIDETNFMVSDNNFSLRSEKDFVPFTQRGNISYSNDMQMSNNREDDSSINSKYFSFDTSNISRELENSEYSLKPKTNSSTSQNSFLVYQTIEADKNIQQRYQEKTLELAQRYNDQSVEAITNFFGDVVSLVTLFYLLYVLEIQINITQSFLLEVFFGLDDSKKSLLILLVTDLLVGYHSSNLWELFFELFFNHYGLPESQTGIFLLVATLPVLLDVLFKYLIFRHLNRSSPATVATYHAIIE